MSFKLNNNVWKLIFWTIVHVLCKLNIAVLIHVVVITTMKKSSNSTNFFDRLKNCDLFVAYYNEIIRFVINFLIVCKIVADIHINEKILRVEIQVMLLYQQLLMNEKMFNSKINQFNSFRFLTNSLLIVLISNFLNSKETYVLKKFWREKRFYFSLFLYSHHLRLNQLIKIHCFHA